MTEPLKYTTEVPFEIGQEVFFLIEDFQFAWGTIVEILISYTRNKETISYRLGNYNELLDSEDVYKDFDTVVEVLRKDVEKKKQRA